MKTDLDKLSEKELGIYVIISLYEKGFYEIEILSILRESLQKPLSEKHIAKNSNVILETDIKNIF